MANEELVADLRQRIVAKTIAINDARMQNETIEKEKEKAETRLVNLERRLSIIDTLLDALRASDTVFAEVISCGKCLCRNCKASATKQHETNKKLIEENE